MLTVVVAFAALQIMPRDGALAQELLDAAHHKGWAHAAHGHPIPGRQLFSVNELLMYGNHYIHVKIDERTSAEEASIIVQHLKKTKEVRSDIDERLLKRTGLKIDVLDYKNKRLSSMKAYAATNLRIFGVVGKSAVFIIAEPPGVRERDEPENPKSEERVYDDVIGFAKLIARELKKK